MENCGSTTKLVKADILHLQFKMLETTRTHFSVKLNRF